MYASQHAHCTHRDIHLRRCCAGEGVLSVESDRAPLVLIAHMLGFDKDAGHENPWDGATSESSTAGRRPGQQMKLRRMSTYALAESILLDPASVVNRNARKEPVEDTFKEALRSYRDVVIAAMVVSHAR